MALTAGLMTRPETYASPYERIASTAVPSHRSLGGIYELCSLISPSTHHLPYFLFIAQMADDDRVVLLPTTDESFGRGLNLSLDHDCHRVSKTHRRAVRAAILSESTAILENLYKKFKGSSSKCDRLKTEIRSASDDPVKYEASITCFLWSSETLKETGEAQTVDVTITKSGDDFAASVGEARELTEEARKEWNERCKLGDRWNT